MTSVLLPLPASPVAEPVPTFSATVDALRAVAESTRLRILAILGHGERTVSELTEILGQSQPRVSRHLRILDEAGLLDRVPEGNWVFYRLRAHAVVSAVLALVPADDPVFAADQALVESLQRDRADAAESYFREHAHEWARIRSLYVSEAQVEQLVIDAAGHAVVDDLLDVGTGTGRMLELLAPRAARAVGIDSSAAMLAAARPTFATPEMRHVQLRLGDMYRLPMGAETVDLAVIHQVLHFAADPARVLREVARVLRRSGRALIIDFAPHTVEFLRTDHAHRRLGFTTDEVGAWGEAAGLSVTELARLPGNPLTVVLWQATAISGTQDRP